MSARDPQDLIDALEAIRWALDGVAKGRTVTIVMRPSDDAGVHISKTFDIAPSATSRTEKAAKGAKV